MRFLILLFTFFVASHPQLAHAVVADDEPYTISGVAIDMPTKNATDARDAALAAALPKAYAQLRDRRAAAGETLPELSDAELWKVMQDFEVENERVSASRYLGNFTIRFKPTAIMTASAPAAVPVSAALQGQTQFASVRFTQLGEWPMIRNAIQNGAGVQAVSIRSFRTGQVDVAINYAGDVTSLATAFSSQGLVVSASPYDSSSWIITR